jgi:DNA end-binding protein Ku
MAYRSVWKGFLKLALITCPVAIYKATGEIEPRHFTRFNRQTGNRIGQINVDAETGKSVDKEDIARGVEVSTKRYAEVTDEEIAAAAPRSAAVIDIEELVPPAGIGWLFPDAHYYMGPDGLAAGEAFALLRDGIARSRLVALGRLSLGTREHIVAIAPGERVLKLSTLRYAAEVRSEDACFPKLADLAAPADLVKSLDIILQRRSSDGFEVSRFADRYAAAIEELVLGKISGKMVARTAEPPPRLIDLAKAVKRSAAIKPDRRAKPSRGRAA